MVLRSADDVSADGSRDAIGAVMHADRKMNVALAERTRAIAEAHDSVVGKHRPGSAPSLPERSFRAEIAMALGVSERTAENLIGNAVALVEALPATMDALDRGDVTYRHAVALVDELCGLEPSDLATLETALLPRAMQLTPGRLRTVARIEREKLHPETMQERNVAAADERNVWLDDQRNGRSILSVDLDSATAHAIFGKLTTGAKQLKLPGDLRTLGNRRSDIFAHIMLAETAGEPFGFVPGEDDSDNFVKWFRGIRPTVIVSVPVLTLLGQSDEPATLDGVVPHEPRPPVPRSPCAQGRNRLGRQPGTRRQRHPHLDQPVRPHPQDLPQRVHRRHVRRSGRRRVGSQGQLNRRGYSQVDSQ